MAVVSLLTQILKSLLAAELTGANDYGADSRADF